MGEEGTMANEEENCENGGGGEEKGGAHVNGVLGGVTVGEPASKSMGTADECWR